MPALAALSVCLAALPCIAAVNVAVIGAGAHGLIAALVLSDRGNHVTVFEKETTILPIVQSLQLKEANYDYLSQLLLPGATPNGFGPPAPLAEFASRYDQPLLPLPLSRNPVFFDTAAGITVVPAFWQSYLASQQGQTSLLQQLAAGVAIFARIDQGEPTPEGILALGICEAQQTYGEWAAAADLPAFTNFVELFGNSALSGPVVNASAAVVLNAARLYVVGSLRQAFQLQGIAANTTAAIQAGINGVLQGGTDTASLFHLPNGAHALFSAAVASSTINLMLETPVTAVSNSGLVTFYGGQQQFDAVIVTVRPEPAAAILSPPLAEIFVGRHTGLVDVFIFNASLQQPTSALGKQLQLPFIGSSTVSGGKPTPPDGTPSYIVRVDGDSPFVCVGSYVTPQISSTASKAVAIRSLTQYGFNVSSTVAYERIQYPSFLPTLPAADSFENVYLLGEAIAGIGITTALEYVPARINAWFGPPAPINTTINSPPATAQG